MYSTLKAAFRLKQFCHVCLLSFCVSRIGFAQSTVAFADSIRIAYAIPELNYAVVSSEKILDMHALGYKRVNTTLPAQLTDRFRIGSNTKTVTAFIAALLVNEKKISWNTAFFDLFPELKAKSNPAYYPITLRDLLTFRANVAGWTYTSSKPTQQAITGTDAQQRYAFASWLLHQKPDVIKKPIYRSNPSYVLAGLLLERATGKDYKQLVQEFGERFSISFGFGQPNFDDINQPWGHSETLKPEPPTQQNFRLNWLLSAGNLNVSLPGYLNFIQVQLQGLAGKSTILTADEFNRLHYGLPEFSYGWEQVIDKRDKRVYSFHRGNPGTFLTKVYVCKATDRAYVFFANVQSARAEEGLTVLFERLATVYNR